MRLKFYLMGLGIGVIVAAVIMGIAMRGRTREMTDEEIMARARQLGMVEAGTLTELTPGGTDAQNLMQVSQTDQEAQPVAQTTAQAGEADNDGAGDSLVIEGQPVDDENPDTDEKETVGMAEGTTEGGEEETDASGASASDDASAGRSEEERSGSENDSENSALTQGQTENEAPADRNAEAETANSASASSAGQSAGENSSREGSSRQDTGTEASATGSVVVTIPDGLYSEDICALLQEAGVVDDWAAFNDYLVRNGLDGRIGVGARLIPRGSSYEDVARIIAGG